MKKFILAVIAVFAAISVNAQGWETTYTQPDEMKGTPGYYTYCFNNNDAVFAYFSHTTDISGIVSRNGSFDTYSSSNKFASIAVGFYKDNSLSYKTVYQYCPVGGDYSDAVSFNAEETATILAWLSRGREYSVRFIIPRYNKTDLDFVVKGR